MSEIIVPKSASELYEDDSGVRISIDEKWPTDAASWLPVCFFFILYKEN